MNREELAWAAGFFDGEGHVSAAKNPGRSYRLQVQVVQTDPEVLERFKLALGGIGAVSGPRNYGHKDVWTWKVNRFEYAQAALVMLWPFLSTIKRGDTIKALSIMRSWHAEKVATCRSGRHLLAEVGLTSVGSCLECHRDSKRRYRQSRPEYRH